MPRRALECLHSFADRRHRLLEGLYCYANVRTIQSQTQLAKALAAEIARLYIGSELMPVCRDFAMNELVTVSTPASGRTPGPPSRSQSLCEVRREKR
jgi:hypothetical protein